MIEPDRRETRRPIRFLLSGQALTKLESSSYHAARIYLAAITPFFWRRRWGASSFTRVYPGQARFAVQPWADILRTVGARLNNSVWNVKYQTLGVNDSVSPARIEPAGGQCHAPPGEAAGFQNDCNRLLFPFRMGRSTPSDGGAHGRIQSQIRGLRGPA